MPLGPRLDRPSAVGEQGRPRAASLTVSAVIVVGTMIAAGALVGQPLAFTSAALLVGLTSAGLALLDRDRLGSEVIGHLCFLPPAVAVFALVVFSGIFAISSPGLALLILGSLIAMVGVTTGWNDVLTAETVRTALVSSAISYVFWIAGLILLAILAVIGLIGWVVLEMVIESSAASVSLLGLLGLAGLACGSLYLAVRSVPAIQLTPVQRRDAARSRYDRLKTRLLVGAGASWGLLVVFATLAATGPLRPILDAAPVSTFLTGLGTWATVPLVTIAGVALLIPVGVWGLKRLTSGFDDMSTRTVGALIAAVCYLVLTVTLLPILFYSAILTGPFALAIPTIPMFIYTFLLFVLAVFYAGIVPERAAPSALSAAGLLCVGVGGALTDFPALFVFGAVAGGLVAWDVGTFGLGVTAELGHLPETRRLELYHAVFAVGIGLVGVAALTLLDLARRSVAAGIGTPVAMGVAVVGVVLLLVPLRG